MKTIRYTMNVREVDSLPDEDWNEKITRYVADDVTPEDDAKTLIAEFNSHLKEGEKEREFISLIIRE